MPRFGLALTAALVAATAAFAQAPPPAAGQPAPVAPPPPQAAAIDPVLVAHLKGWEGVMQAATNFYAECSVTRKNTVLKKEATYTGSIICLKPNLARMRLDKRAAGAKPDPNDYTAYICTGKEVYEYDGLAKQVTEYPLRNGGVGDNLLLEFMAGALTAKAVAERFELRHLQPNDPTYIYLEIKPRLPRDKAEFESMILVLFRPGIPKWQQAAYLPRTVVIRKQNGQEEETWDFPQPVVNAQGVKSADFVFVPPPKDWKVQKAAGPGAPGVPAGQPRVARPIGP